MGTHDGRTIRFPDPEIKMFDTVRVNTETNKIEDFAKFEHGNVCMLTGGNNIGRVGVMTHREKHPGSFEIVHLKDKEGHAFATRLQNVTARTAPSSPWSRATASSSTSSRTARSAWPRPP